MDYSETYEQTAEFLRLALRYMGQYGIPVNPVNYSVWYEYASGANQGLKNSIDDHIARGAGFTPEINQELYRRYVADLDFDRKEKMLQEIRSLLLSMTRHLIEMGRKMSDHGSSFEYCARRLESGQDLGVDVLRTILAEVLAETEKTIGSGRQFNENLVNTARDLDALRKELENARKRADTDALTGLANRRAMETFLDEEFRKADHNGRPLSLVFADIDHFKKVNDVHGHLVGDMVLRMSAAILKSLVKGSDLVSRYGGEEFLIVLPDTPLDGAVKLAEKIRGHFEQKEWRQKATGQSIGAITLSFGAAVRQARESMTDLIQRADQALYRAKNGGRNQVRSAQ